MGAISLPPPQYDHPFVGRLIVETLEWEDVAPRCKLQRVDACAWRLLGINEDDMVRIIRHETGHCNGWPNDHPGAVYA